MLKYLLTFLAGGVVGVFIMAIMVASGESDDRDN